MKKFTTGLLAGGILGAVGLTAVLSDRSSRKKVLKGGQKMMDSASDAMDDVKSKIW